MSLKRVFLTNIPNSDAVLGSQYIGREQDLIFDLSAGCFFYYLNGQRHTIQTEAAFAPVAMSGAYSDLTGTPSLGTAASHAASDFDPAGAAASAQANAQAFTYPQATIDAKDATTLSAAIAAFAVTGFSAHGATAARTLSDRFADEINVKDFGAVGDGITDDSGAINSALNFIRAQTALSGGFAWAVGKSVRLRFPAGKYVVASTLNATGLYGSGFVWDGAGAVLIGKTNGTPVIDCIGTGQACFRDLSIQGSSTNSPNIGLMVGRKTNDWAGADHLYIDRPTIVGTFTLACFYNRESESTALVSPYFINVASNAYAAIWDGGNHFNVQSAFTAGVTYPQDVYLSFNENTCFQGIIGATGSGTIPIWIGGSARHKFINTYCHYSPSNSTDATGPAVALYFGGNRKNDFLDLDIHFEDYGGHQKLTSLVKFLGASSVVVNGLAMRDTYPQQSGPIFLRDTGVSSVVINDADMKIGTLAGNAPSWWDSPAAFTVSGRIFSADGSYVAPASFSGTINSAGVLTNTVVLPSSLTAASIGNPGGVSAITFAGGTYSGGVTPTISIAAPPSGGQQAAASVTTMILLGCGTMTNGGTGYAVNDVLQFPGGTPIVGGTAVGLKVTAVSGGAITEFTYQGIGAFTGYSVTPTSGSLIGGSGSGATLTGTVWKPSVVTVTAPGAGYIIPPTVTFSGTQGFATTGAASLSSSITIAAGSGQMVLTSAGTRLGTSGVTGFPVIMDSVPIDGTGIRYSLTASNYTVPQNVSLVRFTQSSVVASTTVVLPTALGDGQPLQFVNYAGAVTALTFSPIVNGWANGSTLAAYTGLRIRWDATAAAWYREQ